MMKMDVSSAGLDIIKRFEGIEDGDPTTVNLDVYPDPVGLPTIGWGHLVREGEDWSGGITLEQAEILLRQDAQTAVNAINNTVARLLEQPQFDALVSFVFNIGTGAWSQSTCLEWVLDGRDNDVPQQLTRWNKSKGYSLLGLARRRVMESDLYLKGC